MGPGACSGIPVSPRLHVPAPPCPHVLASPRLHVPAPAPRRKAGRSRSASSRASCRGCSRKRTAHCQFPPGNCSSRRTETVEDAALPAASEKVAARSPPAAPPANSGSRTNRSRRTRAPAPARRKRRGSEPNEPPKAENPGSITRADTCHKGRRPVRRGPNSRVSRAKCLHSEDISDYILAPQRTSNLSHLNDSRKKPRVNLRLRNERDKESLYQAPQATDA